MASQQFIIIPSVKKVLESDAPRPLKSLEDHKTIEIFQGAKAYIPIDHGDKSYPSAPVTFSRYIGERGRWSISTYDHFTVKAPWIFVVSDKESTFTLSMLNSIISFGSEKTMQERLDLRAALPLKDSATTWSWNRNDLIWWLTVTYVSYVATMILLLYIYSCD
jgi:hypothetical protein